MEVVNSTSASTEKESNEPKVDLNMSELNSDFPVDYGELEKTFKKAAWYTLAFTLTVAVIGMCSVSIIVVAVGRAFFLP